MAKKRLGPELKSHVNSSKKMSSSPGRGGKIMGPKLDKHANSKGK